MLSKVPTTKNLGLRFSSADASRLQLKNPTYNAFGASRPSTVEKPISPHTTIYKFPLPAITSIITRFTGVGLSLGFTVMAAGCIVSPAFPGLVIACLKVNPFIHVATKFALSYGVAAHTLGGLRHVYWDFSSKGLNSIAEFDASSRIIFWASILIACFAAITITGYEVLEDK